MRVSIRPYCTTTWVWLTTGPCSIFVHVSHLLKASRDPSLRIASHYNLGLNAFALGKNQEALRWFRLVRDQEQNRILQRYAVVAISRIRDLEAQPDEFEVRVAEVTRARERKFADMEFRARVGFGHDDNVFPLAGSALCRPRRFDSARQLPPRSRAARSCP